jgi:N6-adenosine-specific RNA methylase IME4
MPSKSDEDYPFKGQTSSTKDWGHDHKSALAVQFKNKNSQKKTVHLGVGKV